MTASFPPDPITAVTHPDPYPYYADLVAHRPIYRDESLGVWVAASADAVSAVLASDICRVRPVAEPVPKALLGSPAGDLFGRLIRMNDGERHSPFKQAVSASLRTMKMSDIAEQSSKWASVLLREIESGPHCLEEFPFHLPVYVMASLLGVLEERIPDVAYWIGQYLRCLNPASSPEQMEQGKAAAGRLLDLFNSLISADEAHPCGSLLKTLAEQASRVGCEERNVIAANAIGFITQACEATAGLISNSMVALAVHEDVREKVSANPSLLPGLIAEVLRFDPPVQNTRRFLAQDGVVAGQAMRAGDAILVVLAAASRDPAVNPNPDCFDIARNDRRTFAFGASRHACPGETPAEIIARAGVEHLLASGVGLEQLASKVAYRPSANVRIALLDTQRKVQP